VYDLVILAPAFLLLTDWSIDHSASRSVPALGLLLYLAYVLPLVGPLAEWTHVQLSVICFLGVLYYVLIIGMREATLETAR
jgi:hypothetical protein